MKKAAMVEPDADFNQRLAATLGAQPKSFEAVTGGYTAAARWRVRVGSDYVFVKLATTAITAEMMRRELAAYRTLKLPLMPKFIAGCDDDVAPFLVIEDLAHATWPPPWSDRSIRQTLEEIAKMHLTPAPIGLQDFESARGVPGNGWVDVAADPSPFLRLGMMEPKALDHALPSLSQLAANCRFDGSNVCHWDLRSDNLCLTNDGVILIDWAEACASNPVADLGAWLPSLAAEGGPLPEAILPDQPEVAAWVAGYFAARAGLPIIPDAPRVREIQKTQLQTALPWALRAAGLG